MAEARMKGVNICYKRTIDRSDTYTESTSVVYRDTLSI